MTEVREKESEGVRESGLSEELVREISAAKNEPGWMLEKRLQGLKMYFEASLPTWGPPLDELELERIVYYASPDTKEARSWEDVPEDIRVTFESLGIPQAEREALSGVGAQYDSDIVYHNLKAEWAEKGVVFENMDTAVRKYPDLVRKHFMTQCVPVSDHKFSMLHAAVWSGGTFIYVPPGVRVEVPMQAYFRMNAERGGQFEHTLIIADEGSHVEYIEGCSAPRYMTSSLHAGCVEIFVGEGATVRYSSIENWSKNVYNLNTKRAPAPLRTEHG
ncbi:MAG: Fe-S cluster assembly protein SufB [Patescibacteria group bacterium]|nr:Fe-S cluster assembly protein SufB [Patescibacteria group bacterium]